MWRRQQFPVIHEPVRRWRYPFEKVCACGMSLPCMVKTILDRQAEELRRANVAPVLNEATTWVPPIRPEMPLLTPGQAARSRVGEHRWPGLR